MSHAQLSALAQPLEASKPAEPPRSRYGKGKGRGRRRDATPWDDDAEIVRLILAGSREHFDMLYEAYFPRVFRFAFKMLRDSGEAEDLTQEVFVTVFRALHTFQGESSLLVWIFGITRNKANRRFRRRAPRLDPIEHETLEVPSGEVPIDAAVDARRMLHLTEHTIEHRLTPGQRRIFQLRHLRQQSIQAIAGSLGKSEDAIKTSLLRMRRTLRTKTPGLDQMLRG